MYHFQLDKFDGFQSVVIRFRMLTKVSGSYGRVKSFEATVVTGNGNGCIGFGVGEAVDQRSAIRLAKNRAGQRLVYVERKNDATVHHDFWQQHHRTYVYARRQPEGHGVVAHRVVKAMCEVAGIKDLWVKVLGRPKNYYSVAEAFLNGLLAQKPYQHVADDTGLLVVEQKPERYQFPEIVARPSHGIVRKTNEISEDEELNVDRYFMHGIYFRLPPKYRPFFADSDGAQRRIFYDYRRRNQKLSRIQRKAQVY